MSRQDTGPAQGVSTISVHRVGSPEDRSQAEAKSWELDNSGVTGSPTGTHLPKELVAEET